MITLTSARRRADEFAAAVDAPSGVTPRPELVELVDVVGALRTHASETHAVVAPRPEFTAQLRERLLAEAAETWSYDPAAARLELPARPTSRRERRLVVAATALVLAGGSAGMAAAAQQSLPGEALYPVKRGLEAARADLTSGDAAKGRTLLGQADGRLVEIQALLGASGASGTDPAVGSTLETYLDQAATGSDLLIGSYAETGEEATVRDVRSFAIDGISELQGLASVAPADLQDDLQAAATALEEIDARASEVCPTCAPSNALTTPASFQPALDDAARVLASVEGQALSNDHPLVSGRIAPPVVMRPDGADGRSSDDATSGATGGGGGGQAVPEAPSGGLDGAGDVPDLTGVPNTPKGGLDAGAPDAGKVLKETREGAKKVTDSALESVDKLGDTVEDVTNPLEDIRLP